MYKIFLDTETTGTGSKDRLIQNCLQAMVKR